MNTLRHRAVVLLICLSLASALGAADSSFFTTIGTRDGLPNSSVSAIVQDRKGFLWFGTQGGLVRYDGYSFRLYENEPFETNTLSHSQVQTLFLDGDVLWIGTYGGLNRLDLATGIFTNYRHDPSNAASLINDLIISIERDAAGRLWVGTGKGLCRLDEKTGAFKRFPAAPADPRGIGADVVRDIHSDRQGTLWVATAGGGLSRYVPETDDFVRTVSRKDDASSLPGDLVMSIDEAPDGTLWFGFWGFGLARLVDRDRMLFQHYKLEDDRVYFVNAKAEGRVLSGTWGGGLFELSPGDGKIARRRANDGPGAIAYDIVYSAFYDQSGVLWLGTNGGGVSRGERRDKKYEAIIHDPKMPGSIPAGKVTAILEDKKGTLWVGSYGGGLSRWNPATASFIHYRASDRKPRGLPNDIVNYLYQSAAGELWVCTNEGLARYSEATDDFTVYLNDPADPNSLADSVVYIIKDAPGGDLWVGTYTKGLDRWVRSTDRFVHYPPDVTGEKGPTDSLVYALEYDGAGNLWIGLNNGLNRMEKGRFIPYRYDPANRDGLAGDSVRNLFRDSRGRLWIGSAGGGLMRYDPEKNKFHHFTKRDGLPNNTVRSILEADDGSLWVGTAKGIGVIDPSGLFFRGYSVFNELKDRDFHIGAWKSADGRLYFGGMNTIYLLAPVEAKASRPVPRLLISSLTSGGKPLDSGKSPAYLDEVKLTFANNDFAVSFSAVDYRDPNRNLYSYKLEGFDQGWSPVSGDHTATYTNLPGGSYRLLVRAADSEGYWNDSALVLPIVVGSPPWLSPLAFVSYLVTLIGVGYLIASVRGKGALRAKVVELTKVKVQLEAANVKLADLSLIDGLTGIANRRRFDEFLPRLYAESIREKLPLSVLMLDLDFFKGYNDRYGHLRGDEALKAVARTITESIERATDLCARFGGEEFVVVLPNTDRNGALLVAERIRKAVEALGMENAASEVSPVITISIGIASTIAQVGGEPGSLIGEADAALYRAKSEGRNRVV
jgi:diguanylate cyclase (GGDEF)-like protein